MEGTTPTRAPEVGVTWHSPVDNNPAGSIQAADSPAGHLPVDNHPVGHIHAGLSPADHPPADNNPVGHLQAADRPAGYPSAGNSPADHHPAGHFPADNAPEELLPDGCCRVGHTPSDDHPAARIPAYTYPAGLLRVDHIPASSNPTDDRLQRMDGELALLRETLSTQSILLQRLCGRLGEETASTSTGPLRSARRVLTTGECAPTLYASTPLGDRGRRRLAPANLTGLPPVTNNVSLTDQECHQVIMSLSARNSNGMDNLCRKPTFSGNHYENPVTFLANLREYAEFYRVTTASLVMLAKHCFLQSASVWVNTLPAGIAFEAFKRVFWSAEKQVCVRRHVLGMRYRTEGKSSMTEFFMKQFSRLKDLSPHLSETEVVYDILQQLPHPVQSLWIASADRSFQGTLSFLERYLTLHRTPSTSRGVPPAFNPKTPPPSSGNFFKGK
ncbi:unnamed protein product [Brassicogethes aeneus]|uniref:Uncharacterized protein n=1 Tax=Brassicogethes aeneus TaxID=1431903 RepID=A0A9P0B775_BRAAE|nr:unnamed protein product [Brassicogethes aeneus]